MNGAASYLFSPPPTGGRFLIIIELLLGLALVTYLATILVRQRSGYRAVRRRARSLGAILAALWIPGGVYLAARLLPLGFFSLRIWLLIILAVALVRLAPWALGLRSLAADKVDEHQESRRQSYFKRAGQTGKTAKKRRRR